MPLFKLVRKANGGLISPYAPWNYPWDDLDYHGSYHYKRDYREFYFTDEWTYADPVLYAAGYGLLVFRTYEDLREYLKYGIVTAAHLAVYECEVKNPVRREFERDVLNEQGEKVGTEVYEGDWLPPMGSRNLDRILSHQDPVADLADRWPAGTMAVEAIRLVKEVPLPLPKGEPARRKL